MGRVSVLIVLLAALSMGCAASQLARSADPKAAQIVLRGLEPRPVAEKDGVVVLSIGQPYRLVADVAKREAPIVKAESRVLWYGGPWESGSIAVPPVDLSKVPNCCEWVYTGWSFVSETDPGQTAELEMWLVDAQGRPSNTVRVKYVTQRQYGTEAPEKSRLSKSQ